MVKARESLASAKADLEANRLNGFVKHGPLDPALGRALNKTLELRKEGDYDLASPHADDVRTALRDAEALVDAIAELCRSGGDV